MDETKKPTPQGVQIEIDDATAQGAYANLAMISHSDAEFIIDFIFLQPQNPKARVRSRIIVSPPHAKRILKALGENISKYETKFGTIKANALEDEKKVGYYN